MTGTSQSTDHPYGQIITDEKTLERLFRAHYAKWIADAKNRLGAEAAPSAPRVVSKAFHLAWQDRKRFHSQEELDAFIGAQVHHGATRELSRRAGLHRMEHHEGLGGAKAKHEVHEMSVDEAWDRLQHTLQGGAPEAYRARASTARHEAAEHMKGLATERNWKPAIALAAVVVVVVLLGIWWIQKAGADRAVASALSAPDVRNYETSFFQQVNVGLDDGTAVRLGPESKLTVPRRFGIGLRAVRIEGIASFDVKQAGDQPFEVRVGPAAITATGTYFVVRKFRDEQDALVWVREGSVNVRVGEEVRTVAANTSLMIAGAGTMSIPSAEKVAESTTWTRDTVAIPGQSLRYIVPQLRRWYGLDIKVPNAALLDRRGFVLAAANSQREAISSVERSAGVKFSYVGENMVFEDTVPGAAATKSKTATKRR
jgi:ferric-dicitrate binding protein FerR (iron transport regulator)